MIPLLWGFAAGCPKPQPRVKARRHGGFIRVYTPSSAEEWKTEIRESVVEMSRAGHLGAGPEEPMDGPVALHLTFYMKRPQRLMRKADPDGEVSHVATPDVDNLAKAVMDALTDTQMVWSDDSQVQDLLVSKRYASKGGSTGCMISIGRSIDLLPRMEFDDYLRD